MHFFYLFEKEIYRFNLKNMRRTNEKIFTIIKYRTIKRLVRLRLLIRFEFIIFSRNFTLPIFVLFNMSFAKTSFVNYKVAER